MQITLQQAQYIAIYLHKGVFEKKYRDICIMVSENAIVGIENKGRKYITYVRYNNKLDKKAYVAHFTADITINELAVLVKEAIERSVFLQDIELNMSKVPMPSIETLNALKLPDEFETESNESEIVDDEPEFEEESSPAADDTEPVYIDDVPEQDVLQVENIDTVDSPEETEIEDTMETAIAEEDQEPDDIPPELFPEEDFREDAFQANEESDDNFEETYSGYADTVSESCASQTAANELKNIASQDNQMLATLSKHSYINNLIAHQFDMSDKALRAFKKLQVISSERAADIYINLLCHLSIEYDGNIKKMAADLEIDEKDIMLAIMEKQLV